MLKTAWKHAYAAEHTTMFFIIFLTIYAKIMQAAGTNTTPAACGESTAVSIISVKRCKISESNQFWWSSIKIEKVNNVNVN